MLEPARTDVTLRQLRERLDELLKPGLIGLFDHVDLVEIIATRRGEEPFNVLSVAVFGEDGLGEAYTNHAPLTDRLISEGFKNWVFGVFRSRRACQSVGQAIDDFEKGGCWSASGKQLAVGPLKPQEPLFVPPDGTVNVPINRILKNNIWNGSHVLRLLDPDKRHFAPFLRDPRRLHALSALVAPAIPLALNGLPDFLGDVLVQLPVSALAVDVRAPRDQKDVRANAVWDPRVPERDLVLAARMRSDEALSGAAVSNRFSTSTTLPVKGHLHPVEAEVWDADTGLLLAATASTSTLHTIAINPRLNEPEPRIFTAPNEAGGRAAHRVKVVRNLGQIVVGDEELPAAERWRNTRVEIQEAKRLEQTRELVQYWPRGDNAAERARALADVRLLIERHGDGGIDLWDPYLNADDLLETLFWSPHFDGPMRALSAGAERPRRDLGESGEGSGNEREALDSVPSELAPEAGPAPAPLSFAGREKAILERDSGNCYGLKLEFRRRHGPEGWSFHDRFLIFPGGPDGPKAWSLGTSVNSLGKAHHILQRVPNAALIAGAFDDLWSKLRGPHHLIWKSWS